MIGRNHTPGTRLVFLIDTNVIITIESQGVVRPSEPFERAAELVRKARENGHLVAVSEASRDDFLRVADESKRAARLQEMDKYTVLQRLKVPGTVLEVIGTEKPSDRTDGQIAALLAGNAAHYMVTEDARLRTRLPQAIPSLSDRMLSIADALELLEALHPTPNEPPPRVERVKCFTLNLDDQIFESFRKDYVGFDAWFANNCQAGQRDAFVIRDSETEAIAGLCVMKEEFDKEYGLPSPRLKLCSFKVGRPYRRQRFGDLLMKAALLDAEGRGLKGLGVTVFPGRADVIQLFEGHGFQTVDPITDRGELILWRPMGRPDQRPHGMDAFEYHQRYGPRELDMSRPIFLIPIQPQWEERLFPEGAELRLFSETVACGNGLRKAYLCHSPSRKIARGDIVLLYRSRNQQGVRYVAVVEAVFRSTEPTTIAQAVGSRTVYSAEEIAAMTANGRKEVLTILMSQSRVLPSPWTPPQLRKERVFLRPPQSLMQVTGEGEKWTRKQLAA
jgi:GNAT superfamily N-acetyltransferase